MGWSSGIAKPDRTAYARCQGERNSNACALPVRRCLVIPHVLGIDMTEPGVVSALAPGASMMKTPSNPLPARWLWRPQPFWRKDLYPKPGLYAGQGNPGGHVGYLMPDEDLDGAHSVFAPFFGIPTVTLPVVEDCQMTGAKAMLVFCELDNQGRYHVTIGQLLSGFPSGDIEADAAAVNAAFETDSDDSGAVSLDAGAEPQGPMERHLLQWQRQRTTAHRFTACGSKPTRHEYSPDQADVTGRRGARHSRHPFCARGLSSGPYNGPDVNDR